MRENEFRAVIPCNEIHKELSKNEFYTRKRIYSDNTHIIGLEAILEYELDKDFEISFIDFMYYQSTSTRIFLENSSKYITVCGYSRQNETKHMMCIHCDECSIILSHKNKTYVCKICKRKYVQ
jgi:hypothetical protein